MKKLTALLLILMLCVCFSGCESNQKSGQESIEESTPQISSQESEPESQEDTSSTTSKVKVKKKNTSDESKTESEPIVLKENAKYVLVAVKDKYIKVNSEEDFANLKVAYVGGTDGEAYAKYYDFEAAGMYNAVNDLHSGIKGKDYDVGLIDEELFFTYEDWEIVWEMKQ